MKFLLPINEFVKNEKFTFYLINKMVEDIKLKFNMEDEDIYIERNRNTKHEITFINIYIEDILEKDIKNIDIFLNKYIKIFEKNELLLTYRKKRVEFLKKVRYKYDILIKSDKLQRIKPPKYVYHSTKEKNIDDILLNGLIPKSGNQWNIELEYKPAIFATRNINHTWKHFGNNVLLQIDTENLDNKWYIDLNLNDYNYPNDPDKDFIMTYEPIPKENIRLLSNEEKEEIKKAR
jgi:hypothetical protein